MIEKAEKLFLRLENRDNESPHRVEDYASILVMLLLVTDVTLQVVTRYLFNHPLGWTEEIARYLLILLTFVGAPIAVRKNSNVSLDFMLTNASPGARRVLGLVSACIEFVYYVLLTRFSWNMTRFSLNRYLVTVRISRSVVFGVITLALALCSVRCLVRVLRQVRPNNGKEAG